MRLIHKQERQIDLLTIVEKAEDGIYDPKRSLLQVGSYSNNKGFNLLWFYTGIDDDLDVHGRALLGVFSCYGRLTVDLLFFRVQVF